MRTNLTAREDACAIIQTQASYFHYIMIMLGRCDGMTTPARLFLRQVHFFRYGLLNKLVQ